MAFSIGSAPNLEKYYITAIIVIIVVFLIILFLIGEFLDFLKRFFKK